MRCHAQHEPERRTARALSGCRAGKPSARDGAHHRDRRAVVRPAEGQLLRRRLPAGRGLPDRAGQSEGGGNPGRESLSRPGEHPVSSRSGGYFRPPAEIDAIVDQALARKAKGIDAPAIWMQLRLVNLAAAARARAAGLTVIVDKCVKMEHGRFRGGLHFAGMNTEIISARKRKR